jgi:hypothetical protein
MAEKNQPDRSKEKEDSRLIADYAKILSFELSEQVELYEELNDLQSEVLSKLRDNEDSWESQKSIVEDYQKTLQSNLDIQSDEYKILSDGVGELKKINSLEADRSKIVEELKSKSDGMLDGLQSSIEKIPFVGKMLSDKIDFGGLKKQMGGILGDVSKNFVSLRASGMSTGKALASSFKMLIPMVKSFAVALFSAMAPVLPLILAAVGAMAGFKMALDIDKDIIELSRNLGIGRDEADAMQKSFERTAMLSNNLAVNTESLSKAQQELSKATGMTAKFSDEMLESQIKLTKFYGLSADEAANLNTYMTSIGSDAESLKMEVTGVVEQFNEGTGASISTKDVLKDIAGLSATMKTNFKGNVTEMAKAVTLAKAMGTSLEKSAQAAEKTLDIESSLKAELTAQMAAGVKIDNSAIRRAQIMGDQEEVLRLQKEQMEEIGDISGMIPKQREAIAKAMNMELSELDEMNERMEMQKALGMDLEKATLEDIKNKEGLSDEMREQMENRVKERIAQQEQLSMQEKSAALMGKLQKVLLPIGEAMLALLDGLSFLGPILNGLVKILSFAMEVVMMPINFVIFAFNQISDIISGIMDYLGVGKVIDVVSGAMDYLFGAPGELNDMMTEVGDVMSPADGKTRISTKEGGLFELSPNDDLVAAPGLLKGGGSSIDLSPLINELKALRQDIQSQPIQMVVDGKVVSAISSVARRQQSVNTTGYGK